METGQPLSALFGRLARNTGSNAVFFAFQQLLGLVSFAILIRLLPLEEFGVILLSGVILGQHVLIDGGFSTGIQKFIPQYRLNGEKDNIARAVSLHFMLLFLVALAGFCVLAAVAGLSDFSWLGLGDIREADNVVFTIGCLMVVYWPVQVLISAGRGFNLHHPLNVIQSRVLLASTGITLALAWMEWSLSAILVGRYLPHLAGAIACWRLLKRHQPRIVMVDRTSIRVFKQISGFSGYVFLINFSSQLANNLDRLWVSLMLGVGAVPIYEGLVRVMKIPLQVNGILKSAIIPVASEVYSAHAPEKFADMGINGLRIFNIVYGFTTLLVFGFAGMILWLLGESTLVSHLEVLQLGMVLLLPVAGRGFFNQMLLGAGFLVRLQAGFSIVTALLYALFVVVGAKTAGITGAVLALPLVHLVMGYPWLHWIARETAVGIGGVLKATARGQWASWLGLAGLVLVMYVLPVDGTAVVIFQCLIPALVLWLIWFRGFSRDERRQLCTVFVRR
jgi:O-antigen/teichoic acid export membrane protein